ncbi:MAG: hypothetical protein Ct9H300mP27_03490 [Chloroflexota bacterium]|nr:MAG: hypothetical protein Ct9H300mP27_03490 [Chloroflexota bacterium]
MAERTKTQTYLAYSFLIGAVIYPLYGHWVWGGGWLGNLEAIGLPAASDYAGSGVVHAVGGFIALAGAAVVGPRIGKFNQDGTANILQGHSIPFVVIGTFILFFGWFGFNINTGDSIGLNAIKNITGRRNRSCRSALYWFGENWQDRHTLSLQWVPCWIGGDNSTSRICSSLGCRSHRWDRSPQT